MLCYHKRLAVYVNRKMTLEKLVFYQLCELSSKVLTEC